MTVSAVLVTRGDVDLGPVLETIPAMWQVVVWDNRMREDLGVYGRYAALDECDHDRVYVQDDDCVTDPAAIAAAYEPGRLVANMPPIFRPRYPDSCLVGFGAVFDRALFDQAEYRFLCDGVGAWKQTRPSARPDLHRTCDVMFTALTDRTLIDVPVRNLPWATGPDRMYRHPRHVIERRRMLNLCRQIRGTVAA